MSDQAIAPVFDGLALPAGSINTTDEQLLANIAHSIRLGHPQVRPAAPNGVRICLVGGGPSLADTFDELRALYFEGAKVVTVNGAYRWCLEHNIKVSAQIVLDARPGNARFVDPAVPECRYYLASQCHPETWRAVEGRDYVGIWHAIGPDEAIEQVLNAYYAGAWCNIGHGTLGGTTVLIRAIALLRTLGFLRYDLFGADSCFLGPQHHAYDQPENDRDRRIAFRVQPSGHPELGRTFWCAPWHVKQLECFCLMIRERGDSFKLNIHGDGLLAYALRSNADVQWAEDAAARDASSGKD
jgi:hypothetical protein